MDAFIAPLPLQTYRTSYPARRRCTYKQVSPRCVADRRRTRPNLAPAFETIEETPEPVTVSFTKPAPTYLASHTLFRNGPAIYELPHRDGVLWRARHWFDGIGIVHAMLFNHSATAVSYRSHCNNHDLVDAIRSTDSARFVQHRFGGAPSTSILGRLRRAGRFTGGHGVLPPMNYCVTLETIPGMGKLVARTDANVAQVIDPVTLQPGQAFDFSHYDPRLKGPISCAHGIYNESTGEYFNYVYDPASGIKGSYHVFRISPTGKADVLATFKDSARYLHSFALTENYVIMVLWPCEYDMLGLLLTKSSMDSMRMRHSEGAKFVVIARNGDGVVATYHHDDDFFCFHIVNAYEQEDSIHIDLSSYDDVSVCDNYYIDSIITGDKIEEARPVRYTLPDLSRARSMDKGDTPTATKRTLAHLHIDLASVSPRSRGKSYRYMYGLSNNNGKSFAGDVVKIDVESGEIVKWHCPGVMPSEPVFAADPAGSREDDGSLLVVCMDLETEQSFLVIIDAMSMKETTRANLPSRIPIGFHGSLQRIL